MLLPSKFDAFDNNSKKPLEILKEENWFVLAKQWEKNKLFLEQYPNNVLVNGLEDFNVLVNKWDYLLVEVIQNWEKWILEIDLWEKKDWTRLWIERKKVKKLDKPIDWNLIEKEEITINYRFYKNKQIKNISSSYIDWEENYQAITYSNYDTEKEKGIQKMLKPTIKELLVNLFKN